MWHGVWNANKRGRFGKHERDAVHCRQCATKRHQTHHEEANHVACTCPGRSLLQRFARRRATIGRSRAYSATIPRQADATRRPQSTVASSETHRSTTAAENCQNYGTGRRVTYARAICVTHCTQCDTNDAFYDTLARLRHERISNDQSNVQTSMNM